MFWAVFCQNNHVEDEEQLFGGFLFTLVAMIMQMLFQLL